MKEKNTITKSNEPLSFFHFLDESLAGHAKYIPNPNYMMVAVIGLLAYLFVQAILTEKTFILLFSSKSTMFWSENLSQDWLIFLKKLLPPFIIILGSLLCSWIFLMISSIQTKLADILVAWGMVGICWSIGIVTAYAFLKCSTKLPENWEPYIKFVAQGIVFFTCVSSILWLYIVTGIIMNAKTKARYIVTMLEIASTLGIYLLLQKYWIF